MSIFKKIVNGIRNFFDDIDILFDNLGNKISDVLEKVDNSTKVDEAEKELFKGCLNVVIDYVNMGGVIKEEYTEKIADKMVEALGKLNDKVREELGDGK